MWLKILLLLIAFLANLTIDTAATLAWPQCGEFVFPKDDIYLSAEEQQFKRKLPTLFDSFDRGNASGFEKTLKSLDTFKGPLTTEIRSVEKQTLSPALEIVSLFSFDTGEIESFAYYSD